MEDKKLFDEKISRRGLLKGAAALLQRGIAVLHQEVWAFSRKAEAKGGTTEKWRGHTLSLILRKPLNSHMKNGTGYFAEPAVINSVFSQLEKR